MATITGTSGNDTLVGTTAADTISGLAGNDVITGGGGGDLLSGGAGSDTFEYTSLSDSYVSGSNTSNEDTITDFQTGTDKLDFTLLTAPQVYVSEDVSIDQITLTTLGSTIQIDVLAQFTINGFADVDIIADGTVNPGDFLLTEAAPFILKGDANANDLVGSSGNDRIYGGGGADTLTGGAGSDTFMFNSGDSVAGAAATITDFQTGVDHIDLSGVNPSDVSLVRSGTGTIVFADDLSGAETVIYVQADVNGDDINTNDSIIYLEDSPPGGIIQEGGNPNLTMVGTSAADVMAGGIGNDFLYGGAGPDTLNGGYGNDVLNGGSGSDVLTGGAGNDTFIYTSVTDSTPTTPDLITDFETGIDKIDLTAVDPSQISIIHEGTASFVFIDAPSGSMQIDVEGSVQGNDVVSNSSTVPFYLIGDNGGDTLIGGGGNDVIQGGSGSDLIIGGGGGDVLSGGAGSDTFKYLAATDSNLANADTLLDFQSGVDKVDLSAVNPSHISLLHDGAAEFLFATTPTGNMEIGVDGTVQGFDVLTGSSSTPFYIVGDNNGDVLIGGPGQDVIVGGTGNDIIVGGAGADALYGGAGSDTFAYLAASDSTGSQPDTIFDFQTGIDKIDLTAIHTSAKDTYGFEVSGGATYLFVDQGGDGVNDMLIQIATTNFHSTDIVW